MAASSGRRRELRAVWHSRRVCGRDNGHGSGVRVRSIPLGNKSVKSEEFTIALLNIRFRTLDEVIP